MEDWALRPLPTLISMENEKIDATATAQKCRKGTKKSSSLLLRPLFSLTHVANTTVLHYKDLVQWIEQK